METRILDIAASDVHFSPSSTTAHPFQDPDLTVVGPTRARLTEAVDLLKADHAVAFPTETVYGLGANALSSAAVSKIYAAKNRPPDNPLILHIASLKALRRLLPAEYAIPSIYGPLIDKFWPGPLTILLPLDKTTSGISSLCTGDQATFAVRMPQNTLTLALLHMVDVPLAAPSANTSTRPSPTTAQHVHHDLKGLIPLILDGGPCHVGLESTVVDGLSSPPQILRPGGVTIEQIRAVPGWHDTVVHRPGVAAASEVPRTPGMKYRHYSPTAKIILFESTARVPDVQTLREHDVDLSSLAICRTRHWPATLASTLSPHVRDFSMGSSGAEISRRLFALLRDLDSGGITTVLVEGIAEADEGLAVMNRLRKAASITLH